VATRRQATGLLVAVTLVFVLSSIFAHSHHWLAWVEATSVASMVGGLADWFAVTALFRHPLGLPIPHTAIVVARKDRFAETLGAFVQESFLSPESVNHRLETVGAIPRLAAWLADPGNASSVASHLFAAAQAAAGVLGDEDVHEVIGALVRSRLDQIALAPLAGSALAQITKEGRHQPTVDAALGAVARSLRRHAPELHRRLGARSPWWLPGPIEERIVDRLIDRSHEVLADMASDRYHPLRLQIDGALTQFASELQTSPSLRRRGEEIKHDLAGQKEVRAFAANLWADVKDQLSMQTNDPNSDLHRRLSAFVSRSGARLRDEPELSRAAARSLSTAVGTVLGRFEAELAGLVSGTIQRWDAAETSRRLELLLGPDLQYIRINGTVVGALAGLALYAVSRALA
jgi:uncharacterized membrane-anchored protein YjiN (DUF445 family)